jgi:hypothetical protein
MTEQLTLPGADLAEINTFLDGHPDWYRYNPTPGLAAGWVYWERRYQEPEGPGHHTVRIPCGTKMLNDAENLAESADEIARIELGLNRGDFRAAIRQLAELQRGLIIPREVIEGWAGHRLTDVEVVRLAEHIPMSSIPDAVETIVHGTMGVPDRANEEDEEAD